MNKVLPAPLQPPDVDLRGMEYMPVYIERLRRSRALVLAASEPAAGFAMRLLWEESWWELPAGSLENDDLTLASAARCSRDDWKKRREIALYGWKLCSDGRWYHPIICEIAWDTWLVRLKHRHKNECDRIAKANKRAIDDAQKPGATRRHAETKPIPSFEAWVTSDYPATAAKLTAAAATPSVPAPAVMAPEPDLSPRHRGAVAEKPSDFAATEGECRADLALKVEGKGKNIPPTPLGRAAATDPETGKEWQREADFAAYMAAVGQPDAPTATCWRAWLGVVRGLPERRVLLARVAAWRKHCAQEAKGKARYRPLGPARLLREGTLDNFAAQADALLANEAATVAIEMAEDERAARTREAWGDLMPKLTAIVGGDAVFHAWFGDAWPEREADKLVIFNRTPYRVNWIRDHYLHRIETGLGCVVEIRQAFEQRGAA